MVAGGLTELEADRVFHALADATRRDILRRCIEGEPSVSRLAGVYPMSFAAVHKHVAVLEQAGLVTKERRGREQLVRTAGEAVDRARPMSVISVEKDFDSLSFLLVAEFEAPIERVWQLWADPRQLERWWGPPTYPATVDAHDLRPGGRVEYHMTGPEGDQPRGFWEVDEVEPPHRLVFRDGFANEDGTPNTELPMTTARVTIQEIGGGKTRMSIEREFPTVEAMEQLAAMGMDEGLKQAVGQIDAILAEDRSR